VRKLVAFAAVWLAAAAVAVLVAWQGVGIVTNQVTDDRPAPLAAGEVRALTREAQRSAAGGPATTTTVPQSEATAPGDPAGGPPTSTAPAGAVTPGAATATTAPPGAPTTTPASPSPTTTAPAPAPTTAPPADAPAETRTYNVVGGSASLRFSASGVTVVWATPAAGFEVQIEPEGPGVQVEFESEEHRSRVTGWWDGGPRDDTREDAR
jgi:hypothetical protein